MNLAQNNLTVSAKFELVENNEHNQACLWNQRQFTTEFQYFYSLWTSKETILTGLIGNDVENTLPNKYYNFCLRFRNSFLSRSERYNFVISFPPQKKNRWRKSLKVKVCNV